MKSHYTAMKNKLLASMLVVPAIPFILVVVIGYTFFSNSLQSETVSKMTRIVEDHGQMIDSFLNERRSDLEFVAHSYTVQELTDKEKLGAIFKQLQRKSIAFTDIGVFNEKGLHVAYIGPFELEGREYGETQWFMDVLLQNVHISDIFLGYREVPHFIMAVVKEDAGSKWIIRATIDSSLFSDVVEKIRVGKTGEAYIVNTEGRFQTTRRSGGELMEPTLDQGLPERYYVGGVKTFVAAPEGGESYLYAAAWLNNKDWLLVARQETAEAFEVLRQLTLMVIVVTVLGGAVIVAMAFKVTGFLIGRMETLDTEKKELGQQLVVAGRLAEIGEMSAGFAHEINNPLQIIKSELTLAETILQEQMENGDLKPSEDTEQVLDSMNQIRIQVDRCGGITQGLLKFARQKETQPGEVNLAEFLPSIIRLVEKKASVDGIRIQTDIKPGTPPVFADTAHLEQVLVNLLNNAIYAVVEKNGSTGGEVRVASGTDENNQVTIAVSDTGSGISKENMEKIFTPFFTTKPVGKGTGLGLPICFGLISEMGGQMEVKSEPGAGTTFTVHLKKA
jgi:two-component system NtrC family sensor kinase